ncbi:MAG: hypothetical protein V7750_13080 [Sneathiella sp.]
MKHIATFLTLFFVTLTAGNIASVAQVSGDRYVGYYYPAPQRIEVYCARVSPLADVDKKRRVGFIIGIKSGMTRQSYESPYAVFSKGGLAEKLLIISKRDGHLDTVYRARALLADLSTSARSTPVFTKTGAAEELTFLDLITMLGFRSVTLSDGNNFAHQVLLLQPENEKCKKM